MAYVTGVANSFNDLLVALRNACTAEGWTLSGNILHKGTCFAEVIVSGLTAEGAPADGHLRLRVGNGKDGANALTDFAGSNVWMGMLEDAVGSAWTPWDWPVTYHVHIHTNPDEVFLIVNYNAGERFQWLAFGQSPAPGNAGTGNWQSAPIGNRGADDRKVDAAGYYPYGGSVERGQNFGFGPFWWGDIANVDSSVAGLGSQIHGAIRSSDGAAVWSSTTWPGATTGAADTAVTAGITSDPLMRYSPNAWNQEAHLVPIQIFQTRPSSKISLIGELKHIRMCRNDYINPGAVITLGPDQWKVYPCYKKNAADRDGEYRDGIDHSGTIAMAIRY